MNHKINCLLLAVFSTQVNAAAFDRNGQSISAFLQPGNYFEAGLSVTDSSLQGQEAGINASRQPISDIANSSYWPSAALKLQLAPKFSFGFIYDEPFGSDTEYSGNNSFVATSNDIVLLPGMTTTRIAQATSNNAPTGNTKSSFDIQNLSFIFGYQPNKNWNFYLGPTYENFKSQVELRGAVFSLYNGYDFHSKAVGDWGWLAGFAYQISEKGLKASLTYRSEIEHKVNATENAPLIDMLSTQQGRDLVDQHLSYMVSIGQMTEQKKAALNHIVAELPNANSSGTTKFKTPDSVNLEFQTGLRPGTLLFGNVRWVNWSDFSFQPYRFGEISKIVGSLSTPSRPDGFNLVRYYDDQWSANLGLGQKLSQKWFASMSVGWDSGAGEKVSSGGPVKGYYNVGIGAQYSPTAQTFISGGVKYFWLGDAKAQLGAQAGSDYYVAEFSQNHSIGYGLKLGYKF
ncbi:OmpP1/FadL family transporter [Acinetobacter vivianii]|uniref:OmpP1/FadL family transporter n=1 Tax=Acinetobacter vivianii TaxID=1776742 RepID=UPI002DB92486|nr:outer membrane protein transport protein [Acinetobacter vivianii]MEB6478675.1 outer membrane protein transport protein [Acinetobacter vivianii]MEB6657494.1 outer membrane protein transport protein [Acinetobacter vivianii]